MSMSNVKYLYVRDNNNFPVGTFAYKAKKTKKGKTKLSFAYSAFYMKDQFSREYGRELTAERLGDSALTLKGESAERLLIRALRQVAKDPSNPWVKGRPALGHRFASACRATAAKLGAALGKQIANAA